MKLRSTRVVLPGGERPATIAIDNGRIAAILPYSEAGDARDVGDLVISPGIVDTHVHINEPGRTEWEGFDTATRAAAAGGVTTLVDMPLNSIPATTTVAALEAKRAAARGRVHVDVAFWGGVVPGNAAHLEPLVAAGVRGFKCFLAPSGVEEFPAVGERDLREAMPILARLGVPLLVHAEDPRFLTAVGATSVASSAEGGARAGAQPVASSAETDAAVTAQPIALRAGRSAEATAQPIPATAESSAAATPMAQPGTATGASRLVADPARYQPYLASRPPRAEVEAIALMVRLAREFGVRVHIVHVACEEAVAEIARAKADGVPITAESCPHYLTFSAEEIPDGATEFKCAPPIREARHREALWSGLRAGTLDLIATDHSPAPAALKCRGDFVRAWGGIASLELSLAAIWSAAQHTPLSATPLSIAALSAAQPGPHEPSTHRADASLEPIDLARWLSERPARLAGLEGRKGRIAVGVDADLMIWDPTADICVDPMTLQQRHKLTPYAGCRLRGVVKTTIVRGEVVWDGAPVGERLGRLL